MLIGRSWTAQQRVGMVLFLTFLSTWPAIIWAIGAKCQWWLWPQASGPIGVTLGFLGGAIVFLEMLIAPRKWLRGWRLGATRLWMKWHVYLGFAIIPIIIIHSGFAFGGLLSSITFWLFIIVIASGVFGLIMQQVIPAKLLHEIPSEMIAQRLDVAVASHRDECRELVKKTNNTILEEFFASDIDRFLATGQGTLASATESARLFQRLRSTVPTAVESAVDQCENAVTLRQMWNRQRRLYAWLHGWLIIHLPVSVAMTGFMIIHAILAMRWF